MTTSDAAPLSVVLCGGSDCAQDQRRSHQLLARRLDDVGIEFVRSRCLGVCRGPVAVVADERGSAVVVSKVRSKGRRKRLVAAIASGCLSDAADLASRVDDAKRRDRAIRRAGRSVSIPLTAR